MVLIIFVGGIFLGFMLGFAVMALLAARHLRRQCEAKSPSWRRKVDRSLPAMQPVSGASCHLSVVP